MSRPPIHSYSRYVPMIYAYTTPQIAANNGWIKIGYTEKQTVAERVRQQGHTIGVVPQIEWQDNAMYKDGSGEYFRDTDFHSWLVTHARIPRSPGHEWFETDAATSRELFYKFASRKLPEDREKRVYSLRSEQQAAVAQTKAYFEAGGEEYLWNAKPRFGKTLAAYDLVQSMNLKNVLIVTNRPGIANSWAEDYHKFLAWKGEYAFVSDTEAARGYPGVLSSEQYFAGSGQPDAPKRVIAFESLQGLKGSLYFGGNIDKLKWLNEISFDLLIVDESQEGIDTELTEFAFDNIKRKYTLYLSGTPFRQLASAQFREEQIFNWSYADEQEAKEAWRGEGYNPYERMPKLSLFTYKLSDMILAKAQAGIDLSGGGHTDYAFDLNDFFLTNASGKFIHEADVRKFLRALATGEKFPFSTPELRDELRHTMWHLNRVASAKALKKLLAEDEVFGEYEVILAVGDGRENESASRKVLDQVREAIKKHEKTITLTVGQLTVGVTLPELGAVLMLCNLQSPSAYMQAAFRAQNPHSETRNGQFWRKENAYIFDFDPARTLIIYDQFANNLSRQAGADRKANLGRLLNFLPVLGEDEQGEMLELDAEKVLAIPRKLKSQEVVRRGFMSNYLFQNIANIFGAPDAARQIIEKLGLPNEELARRGGSLDNIGSVAVDAKGGATVPKEIVIGQCQNIFGAKKYEGDLGELIRDADADLPQVASEHVVAQVVKPVAAEYGLNKRASERIARQVGGEVKREIAKAQAGRYQKLKIAELERDQKKAEAASEAEKAQANAEFNERIAEAGAEFEARVKEIVAAQINAKRVEVVEDAEKLKAEAAKSEVEDGVRQRLRGFARTIPSFLMAYGDDNLTLANLDQYVSDEVFQEVTGISLAEFRFLRDGGDYEENGQKKRFAGQLFDEIVFNDSVREFLGKKRDLANYFDDSQEEDIFDYIPPQKTNQIFTPKAVVIKMADALEAENPGCFDDPNATFADLYMKSGLYIAEIVRRLYNSAGLKAAFPDGGERVRHILEKQVYGMAPTEIIYRIALNFILGFDENLKGGTHNFALADAAEAAKKGGLEALVNEKFGA